MRKAWKGIKRSGALPVKKTDACKACRNLACVFAISAKKNATRHEWEVSKNSVAHYGTYTLLQDSSKTCGLCALMLACFTGPEASALIQEALNKEALRRKNDESYPYFTRIPRWEAFIEAFKLPISFSASDSATIGKASSILPDLDKVTPVRYIVEEVYGFRKRISHIRVAAYIEWEKTFIPLIDELLRSYSEYDDLTAAVALGRPVKPNANCAETLQLARGWVEDCYKNHLECRWSRSHVTDEDPLLPLRIIDIGKRDGERPRLILSNGRRGKWVALSHRWPSALTQFLKTEGENISSGMEQGFPLSALALTFQDAIRITRALEIRYLWVDSLCIIQDSLEDWNEQSAQMAKIYKNAYVTIAAAATANCLDGILVQREWVSDSQSYTLPVQHDVGVGTVHIDFCIDRHHGKGGGPKTDDVNYLSQRAWCFQESQLSHRLLIFDRLQMSYVCLRHGLHEDRETVAAIAKEYRNDFLPHFNGNFSIDVESLHNALKAWYKLLADYTARKLTFSGDKLVALSGIANVVGNFIQDKYYAGIWRKSLPQSLLWSPYDEEDLPDPGYEAAIPYQYRAPSWSWASIDSRISGFICREALSEPVFATIEDIGIEISGPDIYGQVSGGFIVLRGPFRRAFCGMILSVWPNQPQLWWESGKRPHDDDISHCIFDHSQPAVGSVLWCLRITPKYGLLLLPKIGSARYSRIGIFHLRTRDVNDIRLPFPFSEGDIQTVEIE